MIKNRHTARALRAKKIKTELFTFDGIDFAADEKTLPPYNKLAEVYNAVSANGSLTPTPFVGRASFNHNTQFMPAMPEAIARVFAFTTEMQTAMTGQDTITMLIAIAQSGRVYSLQTTSASWHLHTDIQLSSFTSELSVFNNIRGVPARYGNKTVFVLITDMDAMHIFDGETWTPVTTPHATGVTRVEVIGTHADRLFIVLRSECNTLRFSQDQNPTNWQVSLDEGGFIKLPLADGKILELVSFMQSLYIFTERAIFRLTAHHDQTQFQLTRMYVTAGEVIKGSVVVAEDRILYMTRHGLCSFDGMMSNRPLAHLEKFMKNAELRNVSACYHDGEYHIALRKPYDDGMCDRINFNRFPFGQNANNTVLTINTVTSSISIRRGYDVRCLVSSNFGSVKQVLCVFPLANLNTNRQIISLHAREEFPRSMPVCVIRTPWFDFGEPDGLKNLRSVTISSNFDCQVSVEGGAEGQFLRRNTGVSWSPQPNCVTPNLISRKFRLTFSPAPEFGARVTNYLNYVKIDAEVLDSV
jgi:hypothetical protein